MERFILMVDGGDCAPGYTDSIATLGSVEVFGPFETYGAALEKAIEVAESAALEFDDADCLEEEHGENLAQMRDLLMNPDLRFDAASEVVGFVYREQGGMALITIEV
jgi:hypothetical protein